MNCINKNSQEYKNFKKVLESINEKNIDALYSKYSKEIPYTDEYNKNTFIDNNEIDILNDIKPTINEDTITYQIKGKDIFRIKYAEDLKKKLVDKMNVSENSIKLNVKENEIEINIDTKREDIKEFFKSKNNEAYLDKILQKYYEDNPDKYSIDNSSKAFNIKQYNNVKLSIKKQLKIIDSQLKDNKLKEEDKKFLYLQKQTLEKYRDNLSKGVNEKVTPLAYFENIIEEMSDKLNNIDLYKNSTNILTNIIKTVKFIEEDLKGEDSSLELFSRFKNDKDYSRIVDALEGLKVKIQESKNKVTESAIKENILFKNLSLEFQKEILDSIYKNIDDFGVVNTLFLGINRKDGQNHIYLQLVESILSREEITERATTNKIVDDFTKLAKELKKNNTNTNIFLEKDKGVKTGNIINLYSNNFIKYTNKLHSLDNNFELTSEKIKEEKSKLLSQMEIINPFKLDEIKQFLREKGVSEDFINELSKKEGKNREEVFTLLKGNKQDSDSKVQLFYDDLIKEYKDKLSELINKRNSSKKNGDNFDLSLEEILKEKKDNSSLSFVEDNPANILDNISNYNFNVNTEMIMFLPKRNKELEYYNKDFEENIINNELNYSFWKKLREALTYINGVFLNQDDRGFAKIKADKEETFMKLVSQGKITKLPKKLALDFKNIFFEGNLWDPTKNRYLAYFDNSKKEIAEKRFIISTLSKVERSKLIRENLEEKELYYYNDKNEYVKMPEKMMLDLLATKLVMDTYSEDVIENTVSLLPVAALQKAKDNSRNEIVLVLDQYKSLTTPAGKERTQAISSIEDWISRILDNVPNTAKGKDDIVGKDLDKGELMESIKKRDREGYRKIFSKITKSISKDGEKRLDELLKTLDDIEKSDLEVKFSKDSNTQYIKNGEEYIKKSKSTFEEYLKNNYSDKNLSETEIENIEEEWSKKYKNSIEKISKEEYMEAFSEYIYKTVDNIGITASVSGMIQGLGKMIVLNSLGLNILSGINNIAEGFFSGTLFDQTGEFFTSGNYREASIYVNKLVLRNPLAKTTSKSNSKRMKESNILSQFMSKTGLLQDAQNMTDSVLSRTGLKDVTKKFNWFSFAVDIPEYRNQSSIIVSIMKDIIIYDKNGKEHRMFDGKQIVPYDLKDGLLILKEEFRTDYNIKNWENFEVTERQENTNEKKIKENPKDKSDDKTFFEFYSLGKNAIQSMGGNYFKTDTIKATSNIWFNLALMLKKWFPEAYKANWGKGGDIELSTGQRKREGRYRSLTKNVGSTAVAIPGFAFLGASTGIVPIAATTVLTGILGYNLVKNIINKNAEINKEIIKDSISFMKETIKSIVELPLRLVGLGKYTPSVDTYLNYSQDKNIEIDNIRNVAKQLGYSFSLYIGSMIVRSLLLGLGGDDEEEDKKVKNYLNFIDNQFNNIRSSLLQFSNPKEIFDTISRISILKTLEDMSKLLDYLDEGKFDKAGKTSLKLLPGLRHVDRILNGDEKNWINDDQSFNVRMVNKIAGYDIINQRAELKSLTKKLREQIKEQIKENNPDITDKKLKAKVTKKVRAIVGKKQKNETSEGIKNKIEKIKNKI